MQLAGVIAGRENRAQAAFVNVGNVIEREQPAGHEQQKLRRIRPDDGFDTSDVSVNEGEPQKKKEGRQDRDAENELKGNADDVTPPPGCGGLAEKKKAPRRSASAGAKGIGEQLIR